MEGGGAFTLWPDIPLWWANGLSNFQASRIPLELSEKKEFNVVWWITFFKRGYLMVRIGDGQTCPCPKLPRYFLIQHCPYPYPKFRACPYPLASRILHESMYAHPKIMLHLQSSECPFITKHTFDDFWSLKSIFPPNFLLKFYQKENSLLAFFMPDPDLAK